MERLKSFLEWGGTKKEITLLVMAGLALAVSIFDLIPLPVNAAWIAIVLCGIPILAEAFIGIVTKFDIKADVLVSMALIASVAIGEIFAAGEVAFIMQLGALLEDLTVEKARAGIEKLVRLTPRTARVVKNGEERVVPVEEVQPGDVLRVLPGEIIGADGLILKGQTAIDQSVMTGESMPVDKSEGDDVKSGTVNQFGAFDMKAVQVGEDSSIQRMIRLVQSADAGKAKIVRLADRWAVWIVVIALSAAMLTGLFTQEIIRAVTIMVVFCPCALVLATPTAIMAAIGNAAKYGILIREGDAMERLAQVSRITFDKTGTLTNGRPEVVSVKSMGSEIADGQLYGLTASAELRSEHPLGKAIVVSYETQVQEPTVQPDRFAMLPGRGVEAVVQGKHVLAGNDELMREKKIAVWPDDGGRDRAEAPKDCCREYIEEGCSIINIAVDGKYAGFAALADTLRDCAAETVAKLRRLHVTPVLLTGDHSAAARHIADQAGITELCADCLPEDKLKAIEAYQSENQLTCMVGDGINDAPALRKAHVGIAMGGIGSDIAIDAADIVLVRDDISGLPHLLALSKRMMRTIKINMGFSMGLNFLAVALAMTGVLNPVTGALVHNVGSVVVILNSAMLLNWR